MKEPHPSERNYMSAMELSRFEQLRKQSQQANFAFTDRVSFFRTARCKACEKEIFKGFDYCSRSCASKEREDEES